MYDTKYKALALAVCLKYVQEAEEEKQHAVDVTLQHADALE
jgi:hypothetical protein